MQLQEQKNFDSFQFELERFWTRSPWLLLRTDSKIVSGSCPLEGHDKLQLIKQQFLISDRLPAAVRERSPHFSPESSSLFIAVVHTVTHWKSVLSDAKMSKWSYFMLSPVVFNWSTMRNELLARAPALWKSNVLVIFFVNVKFIAVWEQLWITLDIWKRIKRSWYGKRDLIQRVLEYDLEVVRLLCMCLLLQFPLFNYLFFYFDLYWSC